MARLKTELYEIINLWTELYEIINLCPRHAQTNFLLVSKSQPEDIIDISFQWLHWPQKNHVAIVKLDPAQFWAMKQNWIRDILASHLQYIHTRKGEYE